MKAKIFTFVVLIIVVYLFSFSSAQVPQMINYQGKLTKAGTCALDTTITMIFSIYADSTTSTSLWSETQSSVKVEDGIFNVLLGSVAAIPDSVFNGTVMYLGVKVGGDAEMTPRQPIVSVGYAYRSSEADTADYARAFSGTVENADKVDGLHASSTPTADYLYPLDGSAKIPNDRLYAGHGNGLNADFLDGHHSGEFSTSGHNHDATYINDGAGEINAPADFNFTSSVFINNLDADRLDGQHASAFLTTASDYGRSGVAADLYEGAVTLTNKYVNENQASSINSNMIQDFQIVDMDISNSANISPSKILGTAWTSNNDGPGSGLDADLLDGKHAAQFVDGSGGLSYIPKFTAPSSIGNSIIYETGGKIGIGTIGPNTTADVNGDIALRSGNFIAAVGNNNNINIGARSFVIISGPAGAFTITGITGGQDGKMVILYNSTLFNMTIADASPLSAAPNRILTMSGANQSTVGTGNVTLIYDATAMVWVMTSLNP